MRVVRRPKFITTTGGPSFGPPTNLTATASPAGIALSWTPVPNGRYLVFRRSKTDRDDPDNVGNPWGWERLTAAPIKTASYTDKYARELEEYEYRVWSVSGLGALDPTPASVTVTAAKWAPQNHIHHWSKDFSQTGWQGWNFNAAGPTVSGAAGDQTITLTAASQILQQRLACYPLSTASGTPGRTYTYYYQVQGTAGQQIKFAAHDDETSSNFDHTHTFTGGVDDVVFTRQFTSTGRRMRIGPNTYGLGARTFKMLRTRVAAGNLTSAEMIGGYEDTFGPGSTWCEPLQIDTIHTTGLSSLTVSSWHRSYDGTVQTARVRVSNFPIIFQGWRSISRGFHITGSFANVLIESYESRYYGLNPMTAGKHWGRVYDGPNCSKMVFERNYCERTSGIKLANFQGRTSGAIRVIRNLFRDIDGRYVNSDGTHVRSSYGSASGTRPGDAGLGWEAAQMVYVYGLSDPNTPTVFTLPLEVPGVEIAWNECINRPGFSRHEDVINGHGLRGAPGSNARIHHNRIWVVGPWDWHWHALNDRTRAYGYDRIVTTYNLNGVATQGGPSSGASTTAILPSDMASFDGSYLTKNGDRLDTYSNLILGVGGIITVQNGRNQRARDNVIISSGAMMQPMEGAVVPATQNRKSGMQFTHYAGQGGKSGRAFDHTTVQTLTTSAAIAAGAVTTPVSTVTTAIPVGYEIRVSETNWVTTTQAVPVSATPVEIPTTAWPAAVASGTSVRSGYSEVVWTNNGYNDTLANIVGLPSLYVGEATDTYGNILKSDAAPADEWEALAAWQAEAEKFGMAAGNAA